MAPTFPSAIVILIHGGWEWYTFIAMLHSSSTNPYSSLLSSRARSLRLSQHHQITNYSGTCLPTNLSSSSHYSNVDFKLKIPIHPLLQSSISTSHLSLCSCFALSPQHPHRPICLHQHQQSFLTYLLQPLLHIVAPLACLSKVIALLDLI
jgi:hypothetical protein